MRSIHLFPNVKAGNGRSFMSKEKILDCSWEEFEEMVRKAVGSGFTWKIRPRDTEGNRQAVMESVERLLRENMQKAGATWTDIVRIAGNNFCGKGDSQRF